MSLPIIISDNIPEDILAIPIVIWIVVIICFISLTVIFRKELKKLNHSEKTAFIIFAFVGFAILGCLGYAIIVASCALYGAKRPDPPKQKTEYEYDIPGKHYNEPKDKD